MSSVTSTTGSAVRTPVVATEDVTAVGWAGLTVKLELTDDGKTLPHEAPPEPRSARSPWVRGPAR